MFVATGPEIGERIKQLRESAGLSQNELGRRAGISGQAVSLIEAGKRDPTWGSVLKLARALGVTISAFDPDTDQLEQEPDGPPAEEPPTMPRRRKKK